MCRMEVNLNNIQSIDGNENELKKQSWSIISDNEVNKKESYDELNIIFDTALNKLIKS